MTRVLPFLAVVALLALTAQADDLEAKYPTVERLALEYLNSSQEREQSWELWQFELPASTRHGSRLCYVLQRGEQGRGVRSPQVPIPLGCF